MDRARSVLLLETAASDVYFLELLRKLNMTSLKTLCKEVLLKSSGSKAEVIGRLLTYWKRFFTAESDDEEERVSPTTISKVGINSNFRDIQAWSKDVSFLEGFTFMQLYQYLINSRDKTFTSESLEAFKSLKAYKYFADGLVKNVWAHNAEDGLIVVRGHCFSSLKAKTTYTVFALFKATGDVLAAQCKCVAGRGEACSHIAALLFFVEDHKRKAEPTRLLPGDTTVTDHLQMWNIPPRRDIIPKPLDEISFHKAVYGKEIKLSLPQSKPLAETHPDDPVRLKRLVDQVKQQHPFSGLSHFWLNEKPVLSSATEDEEMAFEVDHDHEVREGLMLLARKLIIYDSQNRELPSLVQDLALVDVEGEYFRELCLDYVSEQVIDQKLSDFIEESTRQQSNSDLWYELHNGRITSSVFGEIMSRRDDTSPTAITKRLMGYNKDERLATLPQLKWGREKESVARTDYLKKMRSSGHIHLECLPSGLTLMPTNSYLGASADGIIMNHRHHNSPGVLEIKCPFSINNTPIRHLKPEDIAKDYKTFFAYNDDSGKLELKRSSAYYYQVQGEMAIKKCKWAHFVVWTEAENDNLFIEQILFDEALWINIMLPKLKLFFTNIIVPEILTRKIQQTIM